MKNYKECSDIEFAEAMNKMHRVEIGNIKPEVLSTDQLYIMYTKMSADIRHLSGVESSYAMGLRIATQKIVDTLAAELIRRKTIPG